MTNIRIAAAAAGLVVLVSGTANAADMRVRTVAKTAPVAVAAPVYNWAGLYIGGHGGYGSSDFDGVFDSSEGAAINQAFGSNLNVKGGFGGGQIGYLFQSGPWVYGGELSASFMSWSDQTIDAAAGGTDRIDAEIRNLVTASAKLGYAFNNVLVYGLVGAARADAKWTACDVCGTGAENSGSVKLNKWGLALGGGVEVAFAQRWSVGVEASHIRFNDRKDTSLLTIDSDPNDFAELKNIWTVKGVINYRFN